MINIKNSDSSLLKIDKKSYKNIGIYHIGYITMRRLSDHENINSVNPLYLITGEVDLTSLLLNFCFCRQKQVLTEHTELWDKIKYLIKTINDDKAGEYTKDFMKIKFSSDNNVSLNKILKLHMLTVIVRSLFEEHGRCYPQVFLGECLYEV